MADNIKKINDEINKLRAQLDKDPLKPFDEKDLELFLVPLTPEPKFLVQVDKDNTDLYLIQHNPCASGCAPPAPCGKCADCGKFSGGCVQCGGAAVTDCA